MRGHQRARRHDPRHLARRAGPRGDRRLPGAARDQHPVRDRRRRLAARRAGDRRRREPSAALRIGVVGIPKTIDNDIPFIDHSFGFETAFSRADGVDPRRARRGALGARRRRPGEADGPPLRLHRLLRRAGQERRRLRADPRGAVRPRRRARAPRRTCARMVQHARARRDRRRRGRRAGAPARRAGAAPTRRATRACTTSAPAPGSASRADFAAHGHRAQPQVHRPELRDPQRARPTRTTASTACGSPSRRARRDGGPHRDGRRPLARPLRARADPGRDRAAAAPSTPTATCGCPCSSRPASPPASGRPPRLRPRPARGLCLRAGRARSSASRRRAPSRP